MLPVLQGAARGLQLRAARSLPVLGQEPGRVVPMLTLTSRYKADNKELKVCTEVLETVQVWRLPLPEGQQLEMVIVPGGEYTIGSPEGEGGQTGVLRLDAGEQEAGQGAPAQGAAGTLGDGPLPDHPGPVGSGGAAWSQA